MDSHFQSETQKKLLEEKLLLKKEAFIENILKATLNIENPQMRTTKWLNSPEQLFIRFCKECIHLLPKKGSSVFDLATGPGYLMWLLRETLDCKVAGSELRMREDYLSIWREFKLQDSIFQDEIKAFKPINFGKKKYDFIVASGICFHQAIDRTEWGLHEFLYFIKDACLSLNPKGTLYLRFNHSVPLEPIFHAFCNLGTWDGGARFKFNREEVLKKINSFIKKTKENQKRVSSTLTFSINTAPDFILLTAANYPFRYWLQNLESSCFKLNLPMKVFDLGRLGRGSFFDFSNYSLALQAAAEGGKKLPFYPLRPQLLLETISQSKMPLILVDADSMILDLPIELFDEHDISLLLQKQPNRNDLQINPSTIAIKPTPAALAFLHSWNELSMKLNSDRRALNELIFTSASPVSGEVIILGGTKIKFYPAHLYSHIYCPSEQKTHSDDSVKIINFQKNLGLLLQFRRFYDFSNRNK